MGGSCTNNIGSEQLLLISKLMPLNKSARYHTSAVSTQTETREAMTMHRHPVPSLCLLFLRSTFELQIGKTTDSLAPLVQFPVRVCYRYFPVTAPELSSVVVPGEVDYPMGQPPFNILSSQISGTPYYHQGFNLQQQSGDWDCGIDPRTKDFPALYGSCQVGFDFEISSVID